MFVSGGDAYHQEALAEYQRAPLPQDPQRAVVLFRLGQKEAARKLVAAFESDPERMLRYWSGIGDTQRALETLDKVVELKLPSVPGFFTHREADPLRADPRFTATYRKLGLPR